MKIDNFLSLQAFYLLVLYFISIKIFLYTKNKIIKRIFFAIIAIFIMASCFHWVFIANILFYDKILISEDASRWSMYFNLDKFMYSWVLLLNIGVLSAFKFKNILNKKLIPIFASSFCLIFVAKIIGFVNFDFKITNYLPFFIINNIFFVAFSEEVFFRFFLLGRLLEFLPNKYSIVIANLVFSLIHMPNIPFTALSFVAGFFYTKAYLIDKNLLHSIALHVFVNVIHFVFFTYPYLKL